MSAHVKRASFIISIKSVHVSHPAPIRSDSGGPSSPGPGGAGGGAAVGPKLLNLQLQARELVAPQANT